MSQLSNYLENALGNAALRNTTYTSPATVYAALYSTNPTDADSGTEITGGAYARQAVTFGAPTNGVFTNSGAVNFPVATANYPADVRYIGIRDALAAGNLLWYGPAETGTNFDFVAQPATDLITAPGHTFVAHDQVVLKGESLPTGVDASTIYFVETISGDTFKLALTSGGAAIDLTTTGSGTVVKSGAQTININNQFILPIGNISCSLR
jgi:hypothetical protein